MILIFLVETPEGIFVILIVKLRRQCNFKTDNNVMKILI